MFSVLQGFNNKNSANSWVRKEHQDPSSKLIVCSTSEEEVIVATAVFNRQVLSVANLCDGGRAEAVNEAVGLVLSVFTVVWVVGIGGCAGGSACVTLSVEESLQRLV